MTRDATAIEYFDAASGHYFVTASPKEIAALDVLLFSGAWTRTGFSFAVPAESADALQPVCRFFSDQSFAPQSSHFYTPYAQECDVLKSGDVWSYEGISFFISLPSISLNDTTCPTDTRPLYRIFNNGIGGAPNHRFTTDRAVRDLMLRDGWIAEGSGPDAVAMCALDDQ